MMTHLSKVLLVYTYSMLELEKHDFSTRRREFLMIDDTQYLKLVEVCVCMCTKKNKDLLCCLYFLVFPDIFHNSQ